VAASRYIRQEIFEPLGTEGQRRIERSSVVVVGCGALGSNIANGLTRSGVGRIRIVDRDFVELDNLQRQVLFDEEDVRRRMPKAVAAVEHLRRAPFRSLNLPSDGGGSARWWPTTGWSR